ncbi:hypothetical protein GCM10025789_10000 [Tessaracoccus lubricantis]|uniref:Pyrrolo-quinoline quinone repeat domain-containing protein n=1 Tax=Tessaracoccus lubricantis TaxID=545543 RepID=A0ABP9F7E7_9ACTN
MLDLDAVALAPPTGRRVPAWTPGRTLIGSLAVVAAFVAVGAVLLRPPPPPEPEVLGMRSGPVEAWRWNVGERNVVAFAPVSGDGMLLAEGNDGGRGSTVALLDAATGSERWRKQIETVPVRSQVADLPGTPWVSVAVEGSHVLLDRETGAEQGRLPASGNTWIASSNQGTLFVGSPDDGALGGGGDRVTAYRSDDLGTPLWSAAIGGASEAVAVDAAPVLETGGYAYFPSASGAESTTHYRYVLDMDDGSSPSWQPFSPAMAVVDGVTIIHEYGWVIALDPQSGEHLWRSDEGQWNVVAGVDVLYLVPDVPNAAVQRVDPHTGEVLWAAPVAEPVWPSLASHDAAVLWGDDPIVVERFQQSGEASIVRFDARTGREIMRLSVETLPDSGAIDVGDEQLLVRLAIAGSDEMPTSVLMGVDPGTGDVLWRREMAEQYVFLAGRRLMGTSDGAEVAVYG